MTDLFEDLDFDIAPPDEPPPADILLCQEPGCNFPLEYSGRGRKPKKCDEHKQRTTTPGGTASRPRGTRMAARLEALHADLTYELTLFGKTTSRVLPVFGVTAVQRADRTARALVTVAADNPRVLAALETASKIVPALDLGETAVMLGIALLIDTGRLNPEGLLPGMFGLTETYFLVHGDPSGQEMETPAQGADPMTPAMPLRFQPVK